MGIWAPQISPRSNEPRSKPENQQKDVAIAYVKQLDGAQVYPSRIVTQIAPLKAFYRAEEYHQDYLQRHTDDPYIVYNDLPKLTNLKKDFAELYREP